MQEEAVTPEQVDRAWAQWCRDVERFLAWCDGAEIVEDTTPAGLADEIGVQFGEHPLRPLRRLPG